MSRFDTIAKSNFYPILLLHHAPAQYGAVTVVSNLYGRNRQPNGSKSDGYGNSKGYLNFVFEEAFLSNAPLTFKTNTINTCRGIIIIKEHIQ